MPYRRYRGPLRNSSRQTDRGTGRILDLIILDLILIGFGIHGGAGRPRVCSVPLEPAASGYSIHRTLLGRSKSPKGQP